MKLGNAETLGSMPDTARRTIASKDNTYMFSLSFGMWDMLFRIF